MKVLFVPGNHDLWVMRDGPSLTSLQKLDAVRRLAINCGVSMDPFRVAKSFFIPLMSWYDYSFGQPGEFLNQSWMDFRACGGLKGARPTQHNVSVSGHEQSCAAARQTIISFSHFFVPRIDVMPAWIPPGRAACIQYWGRTG
jgi:hypothetical protein